MYVVYAILMYHSLFAIILDAIIALDSQIDAQWREFWTYLYVKPTVVDRVSKDT